MSEAEKIRAEQIRAAVRIRAEVRPDDGRTVWVVTRGRGTDRRDGHIICIVDDIGKAERAATAAKVLNVRARWVPDDRHCAPPVFDWVCVEEPDEYVRICPWCVT